MAGFTLAESLMSLLIFSFGALGIAALQNISLQSNFEAMQRAQTVFLADDIIERMRNNPDALDRYDDGDDTDWTMVGGATLTQPETLCDQATCSATELAAYDLWAWERALDGAAATQTDNGMVGGLAQPTGCIRQTEGGRVEVAIARLGRGEQANSELAPECTVDDGRYGDNDRHRRILLTRTFIADSDQL